MVIREATESDAPLLSKICLLTADAGKSAETEHDFGELPGLIFAVPYVKLPKTWGFVLEDESAGEVVGYVLGSTDTRSFEHAREHWLGTIVGNYSNEVITKLSDKQYVGMLKNMDKAPDTCVNFSPAHLHISILEPYQRKSGGRKLMERAIEHLKGEGIDAVWMGVDPRNHDARKFYDRLGIKKLEGGAENELGLRF